jgi:uncharacterized protein (TIRG00374 family)
VDEDQEGIAASRPCTPGSRRWQQVPFTPGGLGFVEAGLLGTLTLAGVPGPAALAATLLYRLVSYWLPIPAGGVAYLLFRRRYG